MPYVELLRKMLAEFGPKMTLAVLTIAAFGFGAFKACQFIAGFLEKMQASRDQMIADVMREVTSSRERTAAHEADLASVMATMRANIDSSLLESRKTRDEMHARFNRTAEEHTEMHKSLSEIKGAINAS